VFNLWTYLRLLSWRYRSTGIWSCVEWHTLNCSEVFYVVRTVHFGMKLCNDQRNAQFFNSFIYLLLTYMFRAFFQPIFRGRFTTSAWFKSPGMVSAPGSGWPEHTCPDRPWGPPSLLYNGYRNFPGGRKRPGSDADPSPLLLPRSKNKIRAITLLSLKGLRGL
jgi:hypothetical protein